MSAKGLGMTCVTAEDGALLGVITDGDLRRHLSAHRDLMARCAADVMTRDPIRIPRSALAAEALNLLEGPARHVARRGGRRRPRGGGRPPARSVADAAVLGCNDRDPDPARRAGGAPDRTGGGQGLGAVQAPRRPVDRPAQGARVRALHPGAELPRLQSDRPRDRGAHAGGLARRGRPGDSPDPGQPVPREGPGQQGDPGPPAPAAQPAPHHARARARPAVPRPGLPARRLRGPGVRDLLGGGAPRPAQQACPAQPREAARGAASVARGAGAPAAHGGGGGRRREAQGPGHSRLPGERARPAGHAGRAARAGRQALRGGHRARRADRPRLSQPG